MATLDELIEEARGDLLILADNSRELRRFGRAHAMRQNARLKRLADELAELRAQLEANHEQRDITR